MIEIIAPLALKAEKIPGVKLRRQHLRLYLAAIGLVPGAVVVVHVEQVDVGRDGYSGSNHRRRHCFDSRACEPGFFICR